ncbi:MAG: DUF4250 domain-containing protein [Clostridiales bacterium]|jgi:hypothetical protein|nr:DUF4250 domain-containing protein [Clostridiales bacterium]
MTIPKDPIILLSYINTKLRNEFTSLEDLCKSLSIDPEEVNTTMSKINYSYDAKSNQFILM